MTTPNIEAAKERLNRSISNQVALRERIARSASELRGDAEEPPELEPTVEQEPVNTDGVSGVRGNS